MAEMRALADQKVRSAIFLCFVFGCNLLPDGMLRNMAHAGATHCPAHGLWQFHRRCEHLSVF